MLPLLNSVLSTLQTVFVNLEIALIGQQVLLTTVVTNAQLTLESLTGYVGIFLQIAVSLLTSNVGPLITNVVNLFTLVTSALGSLTGDLLSLLTSVTSSIGFLLIQLGNAANGGTANIDAIVLNLTNALIANVVQLFQRTVSVVASLQSESTDVTIDILQSAYALVVALITAVNLVAQIIAQAASILASLFITLAGTLFDFATYLGNALLSLANVVVIFTNGITQGTNQLNAVVTALNPIIQTLVSEVQPTIGAIAAGVPGPVGAGLSAASSLIANGFADIKTLINAVAAALGLIAPIIITAVTNIEYNNLYSIIRILVALASGTVNVSQASDLMGSQLNTLITGLSSTVTAIESAIATVGDAVATALTAALYGVIFINIPVLEAIYTIYYGLANAVNPTVDVIANIVNGAVATLTNNLPSYLNSIHEWLGYIVGGVLTGPLAPIDGLASALAGPYSTSNTIILNFARTVAIVDALDVASLATNIGDSLHEVFELLSGIYN